MAALLLALFASAPAHAACAVERTETETGVRVVVSALEEPIDCRTVTLTSDAPLTVRAKVWTPDARKQRLKEDHFRLLPGGGWEIGAPELVAGGSMLLEVEVPGETLDIRLAPAPPPALTVVEAHETHTLALDPKHPGWGFADPAKARTRVELALRFPAGGAPQIVPLPEGAEEVETGGLALVPNGVAAPAGTTEATIAYTAPGAAPQGVRTLAPGSLTLLGPGVVWRTSPGPGVTATPIEGGVRFDAPAGGTARWRVERAGDAAVIPDVDTYVAGLDWRFARVSLPEPAVPPRLRGPVHCGGFPADGEQCFREERTDRGQLFDDLLSEVLALRDAALPTRDPLAPRQLNRAWKSGWATPVERALILHRFLGQERFLVAWALTGEAADPETLTGFEHPLLTVVVEGETVWVDPSCRVCDTGEVGTRWLGKPAIGVDIGTGAETAFGRAKANAGFAPLPAGATVPRATGRLDRSLALEGERFRARFSATGAAALWLREQLVGVEPAARAIRLGRALGMPDAALVEATGFGEAGAPIVVVLDGPRPPEDPFPAPDATPWDGGWGDSL